MPTALELDEMAAVCFEECVTRPDIAGILASWAAELEPTEERHRLLTLYRIHSQEYEKALESAKKLEHLWDPKSLNALALAEAANFDYAKAIEHYTLGLALEPETMQLYANRAHVRLLAGDFKEGAADVVRALVVGWSTRLYDHEDPDLGEVQDYFGHVRRMNAKIEGADPSACRVLKVCAAIDEKFGHDLSLRLLNPLVQLGDLAWVRPALRSVISKSQNKYDEEVADLRRAVELKGDEVAVLIRLWGRVRFSPRWGNDLTPVLRLIELCPEWDEPRVEHAEALSFMKRKDEALAAIEKVLEDDAENLGALVLRTRLLREKGDLQGALRDVEEVISLSAADNAELFGTGEFMEGDWELDRLMERAEICAEMGEDAMAALHWQKAFEIAEAIDEGQDDDDEGLGRKTWEVYLDRAQHCVARKRWADALADYDFLLAEGHPRRWYNIYEERAKAREGAGDAAGAEADRRHAEKLKAEGAAKQKKGRKKA